jgi:hypothetical protein
MYPRRMIIARKDRVLQFVSRPEQYELVAWHIGPSVVVHDTGCR